MIRRILGKSKNTIIKSLCYLLIVCLLLVCFKFDFSKLMRTESSLAKDQVNEDLMEVVTNDSYKVVGEVERVMPQTFGLYSKEEYPSSLNILTDTDQSKRESIYNENIEMYNEIETAISENRLKKHVAADGQFFGTVSDQAKGIIKKTYINASVKRYHSLGIYAPAGEVLTIEINENLINKGLSVVIGYEVEANNIPLDKFLTGNKDRMPLIRKSFDLTSTLTKVGTPLGGAVYIYVTDKVNDNFEVTVSGGVDNPVFQLGINSEEDYKDMLDNDGLIMEFKLPHVRLIMPKSYVKSDDIINALKLWHKMSSLSMYTLNKVGNTMPITHYYDSYVPAGAAVAYVGANFSILPLSWGTSSLNYDLQMKGGNWGNFHEFNHHHQSFSNGKWGLDNPGEVTNNVLTVMGYLLYTDIASTRSEIQAPGATSSGWNISTDPYYNFKRVMDVSNNVTSFEEFSTNQLYMYADLMHAFGVEKVIELIKSTNGLIDGYEANLLTDVDSFAIRASKIFGYDLTYYLTNVCKMNLSEETIITIKNMNYMPYLPLYNLYSNGVKNINTGRTYYLNDNTYIFDFNKYTVTTLDYKIKEITKPKYGKLKQNENGTYSYNNKTNKKDKFSITYSITYDNKEYLKTLDFEIDFDWTKPLLKTYSTNKNNIEDALNEIKEENLIEKKYIEGLNYDVKQGNNISISKGKIKVDKTGNYTFAIYGDDKIRFSLNGYEINTTSYSGSINMNNLDSFVNIYLEKGEFYEFSLYCLNTGGNGNARVVYSYEDESNYINVDNNLVYSESANNENTKYRAKEYPIIYDVNNELILNKYSNYTINEIESVEVNMNAVSDAKTTNLYDSNKSTSFHTAWQSNITEFPHVYIIKFTKTAMFDCINIYFTNNDKYYAIGQYELYISDDNKEYKLLKQDDNNENVLNISFGKIIKAKYIKLVVKSNASNKRFTSINEIEVGVSSNSSNLNYYASNSSNLQYTGKWNLEYINNHFNGVSSLAKKGSKVEFEFVGKELVLYTANNSNYRIKIDNSNWINVVNNGKETTPSYMVKNLKNKKHKVVIEALNNDMEIEMIGVDGYLEERNIYSMSFIELYKIISSISIAILSIQLYMYLKDKKPIRRGINKIKQKIKEIL